MSEILERRILKDGEFVFREGEAAGSAFIIQDGEVVITRVIDGVPTELAVIGQGSVFGEMALIDDQPRMATAKVKGGATIVAVTKAMYEQKLKKTDPFVRALLRILVDTVRRASK